MSNTQEVPKSNLFNSKSIPKPVRNTKIKTKKEQEANSLAEFQKNYPKNLFLPIIEFLTEIGYQNDYEKCIGKRIQFQGKNVVSLGEFYNLISQGWFQRNINIRHLVQNVSNKILMNSKIKKKLFHLLILQRIFNETFADSKDFRRRISKQANNIAKKSHQVDDLFNYPNAVIFLLQMFLKILLFHTDKKGYEKMAEEFQSLKLEQEEQQVAAPKTARVLGSKEEYKYFVKEIVHIFSSKNLQLSSLTDAFEETKQSIMDKGKQLREKYNLNPNIPNWDNFIDIVLLRCFQTKKKDVKITNSLFNEWVNQFKTKVIQIQINERQQSTSKTQDINMCSASPLFREDKNALVSQMNGKSREKQVQNFPQCQSTDNWQIAKKFVPIILTQSKPESLLDHLSHNDST